MFKILDKNSASPTLIVVKNGYLFKIWKQDDYQEEILALVYEQQVYGQKIVPLVQQNPELGIMKYIGGFREEAVEDFTQAYLEDEDELYFNSVMKVYLEDIYGNNKYSDKEEIIELAKRIEKDIKRVKISGIILPYVNNCITFFDIIKNASFDTVIKKLILICRDIMELHHNVIVHNDLHGDNILILPDGQSLIYDWDRAYCEQLGDNPLLTERCDDDLCAKSQCNIYDRNVAIDFFKMLSYVSIRDDFDKILLMFGVPNKFIWGEKTIRMKKFFNYSKNTFFSINNESYLHCPNSLMKHVIKQFGHITEATVKLLNNWKQYKQNDGQFSFTKIEKKYILDREPQLKRKMLKKYDKKLSKKDLYNQINKIDQSLSSEDIKRLKGSWKDNATIITEKYKLSPQLKHKNEI